MKPCSDRKGYKKMDTRVFFKNSFCTGHEAEYTSTNWYPPFFQGATHGEQGWAIILLLFLGCLGCYFNSLPPFPSVTPGCCEPNPLLSSVARAQWGKPARPRGTQQCVSRVRGIAPLFLRRWNSSSSQGGGSGRGEHTTLKLFVLFSLSGAD